MTDNLAEALKPTTAIDRVASIAQASLDVKGKDLTVLDVSKLSDVADYFVIVSARSDRQVQGICNRILEDLVKQGVSPLSIEGYNKAHWVLLDFDDVIVHIFYEPIRDIYRLEGLWHNAKRVQLPGVV